MVRIWDATTGKDLLCLRGHTNAVRSVAWSPEGSRLASASIDHTVRIWDPESGREVLCLRGHTGPVHTVAWSPDGRQLASGDDKNTILIHDAGPGLLGERSDRLLWKDEGGRRKDESRQGPSSDSSFVLPPSSLRGEVLARKGEWDRAAADFRQVPAGGPNAWFSAGWWLAGPFLPGAAEPDPQADPCLPPPDGQVLPWLPVPAWTGGVDLTPCLPAGKEGCAYALQRIWSPREQEVVARLEASGGVRFLLNGRTVQETAQGHQPGQPDEVRFVLPAGWSTLTLRVASSEKVPHLLLGLSGESEREWERVRDLIVAERWPEAATALAGAAERHPAASAWVHETAGRLAVGLADRLRRRGKEESTRAAVRMARQCFEHVLAAHPDEEEMAGLLARVLADELETSARPAQRPKESALVPENLALGKPATASSSEREVWAPAMGNDGNLGSRWCGNHKLGEWWQVDLGKPEDLTGCRVVWEHEKGNYRYKVEGSPDGNTWSMLTDQTDTRSTDLVRTHPFNASGVRHVRVTITGLEPPDMVPSFWEFQVLGKRLVKHENEPGYPFTS
jgi:hypothetical protein